MSEADRLDIIEGTDENGNPMLLRVEKYFYYNGEEYVLLEQVDSEEDAGRAANDDRLYVMRVAVSQDEDGEEIEDFEPIDPALMESLIKTVRISYNRPAGDAASAT